MPKNIPEQAPDLLAFQRDSDLLAFQRAMARHVLSPPATAPDGPLIPLDPARLEVHRQAVTLSLMESLNAAFPLTARVLGAAFAPAALAFLRRHPPDQPRLSSWGDGFPDALAQEVPPGGGAAVIDLARLEWAFLACHFAADAPPVTVADFTGMAADDYPRLCFTPHPSARLLTLRAGVAAFWRERRHDAADVRPGPLPVPDAGLEDLLLVRPGAEVLLLPLPPGGRALLESLTQGAPLATAAQAAGDGCDLTALLGLLLGQGAFAAASLPAP